MIIRRLISIAIFAFLFTCASSKAISVKGLHVVGNQIKNVNQEVVMLRGVNRPGSQYQCVKSGSETSIWDGDMSDTAINKMMDWKMNALRMPLNEDCWTGDHGAPAGFSGQIYRTAIIDMVNKLTSKDIAVIVDLHWNSNGTALAVGQLPMPSKKYSIPFWHDVATTFKDNLAVIYDLFNEPVPNGGNCWDCDADWQCWATLSNCDYSKMVNFHGQIANYEMASMQDMVDAVRSVGAKNIIMVNGIQFASCLTKFLQYKPYDPENNMVAGVHAYDFNYCHSRGCYDVYLKPIYDVMPIIANEAGERDCGTAFMYDFMNYADQNGIHYTAWAWVNGDCAKEPALISSFDGTPTPYGISLKTNLNALSSGKTLPFYWNFAILHEQLNNGDTTQYNLSHLFSDFSQGGKSFANYNYTDLKPKEGGAVLFYDGVTYDNAIVWGCFKCINKTYHRSITFWVHGNGNTDQVYQIRLMRAKKPNLFDSDVGYTSNFYDINYTMTVGGLANGGIQSNKWTQATIDLTEVPDDDQPFDGIRIWSDTPQKPIYLDSAYVNAWVERKASAGFRSVCAWSLVVIIMAVLLLA